MNKVETKQWKRVVKRICISIVCFIILFLLIVPSIIVFQATQNRVDYKGYATADYPLQDIYTASDFNLEANEITLLTEDGYELWVSEVLTEQPKAVIIYLSGIRQPSVTYFYGHAKWMRNNGYAPFLLEVRGHGNSDGDRVCLGYEEVSDVMAVVDYIKGQEKYKKVPIVLHGVSMGGAIAINSFGQIKEIDGLIAMSAYSSFEDVVCDTMGNYNIPRFVREIEKYLVRLWLQFVFGNKVNEITPIKQVENIGERPALFVASKLDTEVPPENMERLLNKAPDHSKSWLRNSDSSGHFIIKDKNFLDIEQDTEYCDRILTFLEANIVNR
ncbi:alpha/beta hydrolase [Geosporobacter ferrireducens]|uniref:alpha/beta hydrolase n=1 Tax=Geosporobacter ferrireducens TaxID=1424294 RepID=UPI00139D5A12|nr:alpha/beta hydrolase [Geosporobacter ferrireducens]MTI56275.1 alpha/beta fold hydrolase [Geosporobacter ferrireducens]